MKILGLHGPKGCGKSTFAKVLVEKYGFERLSFAEPIKRMLIAMGVPEHCINDPVLKETPLQDLKVTPRFLMQTLGTEWMRKTVDPLGWVRVAESRLRAGGNRYWVIDDVRFVNETEMIHTLGGKVIKLDAPIENKDNHPSEQELPAEEVDFRITDYWGVDPVETVTNFLEVGSNGAFMPKELSLGAGQ
tara:strand:+ start:5881 stop:6447 length:567 start_codon:yes stop_codon:yes gene_type:complete